MADVPIIPMGDSSDGSAAVRKAAAEKPGEDIARLWQSDAGLSSTSSRMLDRAESFLSEAGFDRVPWLAAIFAAGILT